MSKGDAEHAGKHQHGVQFRPDPPAPKTTEQRVEELEKKASAPAPKPVEKKAEEPKKK